MEKVAFLDRDGVINKSAPPHMYITSWEEFELLPGVPNAIRKLNKAGYKVVIVTNQRCVARGITTIQKIDAIHRQLNETLSKSKAHIDAFFVCPHEIGECDCRKPAIGLFLKAEELFHVDKQRSWMIGDSRDDISAADKYGIRSVFIGKERLGTLNCKNLSGAVVAIFEEDGPR